jgi:ApaG protein
MYRAVTRGIQVTVQPRYLEEESDPQEGRFVWAYTIEIRNLGRETVQLLSRHWRITDATGQRQEVKGPGVVGEQPILPPGEAFQYTSGVPLDEPSGIMVGTYEMRTEGGETFSVEIPAFSLDSPHAPRVTH